MNTFMKRARKLYNRSQKGFTLVELMIVVAIIGILASIAIPNYQKYQAKARTSEAKLYLSGAFTAEKSFVVEYSSYTSCLAAAGFATDAGQNYYAVGFGGATDPYNGTVCGQANTICNGDLGTNAPTCATGAGTTFFAAVKKVRPAATAVAQSDLTGSTVTSSSFTITAAGQINASSTGNQIDKWTITDTKALTQSQIGY